MTLQTPEYFLQIRTFSSDAFGGSDAAPLLLIGEDADPTLIAVQDSMSNRFDELTHAVLDSSVKKPVVDFVARSITSRMAQREGLNSFSYLQRDEEDPNPKRLPLYDQQAIFEAAERARVGGGTALQNELARIAFGMSSIEYKNLTIIGDARKEFELPMWNEISGLVGRNAIPAFEDAYRLKFHSFDRDPSRSQHVGAMRIGMKRFIGKTEFGAEVKSRTTAIVDVSPSSGVDQGLIDLFRDTNIQGGDVAELPEFKRAVKWLVDGKDSHNLVLARNETVYGCEPRTYN